MLVGNTVLSDVGTIKKITSVKLYSGFSCFDPKGSTAGGFVDRSGEFQASPRAVQDEIMIVAFSELNLLVIGVYAFTDQGWGGKIKWGSGFDSWGLSGARPQVQSKNRRSRLRYLIVGDVSIFTVRGST